MQLPNNPVTYKGSIVPLRKALVDIFKKCRLPPGKGRQQTNKRKDTK